MKDSCLYLAAIENDIENIDFIIKSGSKLIKIESDVVYVDENGETKPLKDKNKEKDERNFINQVLEESSAQLNSLLSYDEENCHKEFKKIFSSLNENMQTLIKSLINKRINNEPLKLRQLKGSDKVWEIKYKTKENNIRIFYFIESNNLYLLNLYPNKNKDSLPNGYYAQLSKLKEKWKKN